MRRMFDVKGHCHKYSQIIHTLISPQRLKTAQTAAREQKMTVVQIADKAGLQALFAKGGKAVVYLSATW